MRKLSKVLAMGLMVLSMTAGSLQAATFKLDDTTSKDFTVKTLENNKTGEKFNIVALDEIVEYFSLTKIDTPTTYKEGSTAYEYNNKMLVFKDKVIGITVVPAYEEGYIVKDGKAATWTINGKMYIPLKPMFEILGREIVGEGDTVTAYKIQETI